MDPSLIKSVLEVIIFILMLSLGVNQSLADLVAFWRHQGALLRSLLAVVVLFPLVVFILLKLFPVPGGVVAGLAILAAVPGAPVTYKRSALAGGDPVYTSNLHMTLALLTIIVTPVILSIFYGQFDLALEGKITVLQIVRQVAAVQFLPIGIGLLLQRVGPRFVERIRKPLEKLAHLAFMVMAGIFLFPLILWSVVQLVWPLGPVSIALFATVAILTLAIGYGLGGQSRLPADRAQPRSQRASLAIATIARNLGLALLLAELSGAGSSIVPTILGYALVSLAMAVPFSLWSKRRIASAT
jgi:BASS family bile acid:Na+ symporter